MHFGKPYADLSQSFFFWIFLDFFWIFLLFLINPKLHVITYKNWTLLSSITISYQMPEKDNGLYLSTN